MCVVDDEWRPATNSMPIVEISNLRIDAFLQLRFRFSYAFYDGLPLAAKVDGNDRQVISTGQICIIWVVVVVENMENNKVAVPSFLRYKKSFRSFIAWDEVTLLGEVDRIAYDLIGGVPRYKRLRRLRKHVLHSPASPYLGAVSARIYRNLNQKS